MSTHHPHPSTPNLPFLVQFYDPAIGAPDPYNRTLSTILSWPDSALESSHNYIQILFPLPEYSPINPSAPIIDEAIFTHFRSNPILRAELCRAFERMLVFYGLESSLSTGNSISTLNPPSSATAAKDSGVSSSNSSSSTSNDPPNTTTTTTTTTTPLTNPTPQIYTIHPSPTTFPSKSHLWATKPFTHNHLRITRIIRSLRVLGCPAEAEAFYSALSSVAAAERKGSRISSRSLGFWTRAARGPLNVPPEDEGGERGQGRVWLRGL